MNREHKFALVTGCGTGSIGEALVTEYTRAGVYAIATVLPNEATDHLEKADITFFPLDVTSEESILALQRKVQELTGGYVDVLVNCAGIAYTMTAIDTDVVEVQRMFNVNVFGPMRMVRTFHDMIIQAKGCIVNIGSIGGLIPFLYGSSYNASKAALHHWGNTLRVEMAPFDVKVITYAEKVVSQSLKTSPPAWYWYGSFTGMARFLDTFGWRTVWVERGPKAFAEERYIGDVADYGVEYGRENWKEAK
ncbi:hypothetical protein EKO27_g6375 [Xylaria grammica]|uniref:NAD(P)-binding protein n=1 Tax=Xylaria grammica TaxID=363999 RepID=A0A439D2R3_9PEZI|nr:hypothetical protein EKO27_g6375 [Xylaria grammica]